MTINVEKYFFETWIIFQQTYPGLCLHEVSQILIQKKFLNFAVIEVSW